MVFGVEAWTIPDADDEEPCEKELVESEEFRSEEEATRWAWERLEEGYWVRMSRR